MTKIAAALDAVPFVLNVVMAVPASAVTPRGEAALPTHEILNDLSYNFGTHERVVDDMFLGAEPVRTPRLVDDMFGPAPKGIVDEMFGALPFDGTGTIARNFVDDMFAQPGMQSS